LKRLVKPFPELTKKKISELGTVNTAKFFRNLKIDTDFLECPVDSRSSNDSYIRGKKIVDALSVVNDHAERQIKLMQDMDRSVTQKEGFQDLLLNVAQQRKSLPDFKKKTSAKRYAKFLYEFLDCLISYKQLILIFFVQNTFCLNTSCRTRSFGAIISVLLLSTTF